MFFSWLWNESRLFLTPRHKTLSYVNDIFKDKNKSKMRWIYFVYFLFGHLEICSMENFGYNVEVSFQPFNDSLSAQPVHS